MDPTNPVWVLESSIVFEIPLCILGFQCCRGAPFARASTRILVFMPTEESLGGGGLGWGLVRYSGYHGVYNSL